MKLNLDFSLYKGTTRLKQWWKEVKAHFTQVQEAHNALEDTVAAESGKLSTEITQRTNADTVLQQKITAEAAARANADTALDGKITTEANTRSSADTALGQRITTEVNARTTADNALQQNINTEAENRQTADNALQQKITAETTARETADNALDRRFKTVEEKAHTHTNKTVLDGITEERVTAWDGIKEQVTQTQLDEAIAAEAAARENADHVLQGNIDAEAAERAAADAAETTARTEADNAIIAMLNAAKAYLEDMCFGFTDEFQRVYAAMGVNHYDGGIFGMAQNEIALDGGDFADEVTGTVDCGGFEPIIISTETGGTVIDGGTFDSVATTTIDGGTY